MIRKLCAIAIVFPLFSSAVPAAELPGTWSAEVDGTAYDLTFDDKGGLSIIEENNAIVVAQYEADDGELTITDLGGAKACQGDNAEGTYSYTLASGTLELSRVEDPCEKRAAILDGTTLKAGG